MIRTQTKTKISFIVAVVFMLTIAVGCSSGRNDSESSASPSSAAPEGATPESTAGAAGDSQTLQKAHLVEAWYAKGEDGGYFAALQQGYYKDAGVDMTIQPGGPQVSGLQLVASGKADFGISYADDILRAREQGIPVVGLLAGFQFTPQVLVYHAEDDIKGFEDLKGRTVFIQPGALYWEYVKSKYKLTDVNELNYTGQLVNFIKTKGSLNQGYITNEPYSLGQQGIDVKTLKIADSGYANYCDVLFTTEDYLKKHPDIVEAVVQASQKGWSYYLDNYKSVNPFIQTYNKDMTIEAMNYEAEQETPFILNDETKANGIGYMTLDRWKTVQDQLLQIGGLKGEQDVSKAFATDYLTKP
ncbi:ABC transporter substrate-binding protein [Cohnella sp. REN36]|uniref:ABC transporter substrate-binding protein n=1 Tax=Cohnella sp. REN36 TaxID=2887347 RepID=UPI001D145A2A|nr:ABC transporter substrate-binding protein [Cohnella sp. REN36]MCC3372668.1 ABC transporter substrate-binding protein [Cohnella sp. REN36]